MTNGATDHKVRDGRFVLGTRREEIDEAQERLREALDRYGYDDTACFAIRTAVEEALSNAIHHGNNNDPERKIKIEFTVTRSSVVIDVEDEGRGFEPESVPDPTRPENVAIPSGRGLMLMRVYMTDVEFHPPGNRVHMRYVNSQ